MFNPQEALQTSHYAARVQTTSEQGRLDIDEKNRSSVLPWRGQFSPQLVEYLIQRNAQKEQPIADPFCGSGTVLYEAAAQGHDAAGWDINPGAVALAQAAGITKIKKSERTGIVEDLDRLAANLKSRLSDDDSLLEAQQAVEIFEESAANTVCPEILKAFMLSAFGDKRELSHKLLRKAEMALRKVVVSAPEFDGTITADVGDARWLPVKDNAFDYMITSPPYINVFNYHQNYRPIVEALGQKPLAAARAEIGANRKFRMNRYITVAQYCIDISKFFVEASRILRPGRPMTIVLGRESNVRGVSFRNGELVAAIASEGLGGEILEWNERRFLNRFGKHIFEDVLTIIPRPQEENVAEEIGRLVGIEALRTALIGAPDDRKNEIEAAIEAGRTVAPSPNVLDEENGSS